MLLELELEVVELECDEVESVVVVEVVTEALVLVVEPEVRVLDEVETLALAVPWKFHWML